MQTTKNPASQDIDELYRRALQDASTMEHQERPEYWRAFGRGVQRGFEGESAVPDAEHVQLTRSDETDTSLGYRDGIRYGDSLRAGLEIIPAP
jgi:hypothetical protein